MAENLPEKILKAGEAFSTNIKLRFAFLLT